MKDLICTKCGKKLFSNMAEDMVKLLQAGYCNIQNCKGKLEWRNSK